MLRTGVLLEGSAVRVQDGEEIPVKKGDFWRTPGNVPHTMRAGPEGVRVLDPAAEQAQPAQAAAADVEHAFANAVAELVQEPLAGGLIAADPAPTAAPPSNSPPRKAPAVTRSNGAHGGGTSAPQIGRLEIPYSMKLRPIRATIPDR
jgi:hypothetical protein